MINDILNTAAAIIEVIAALYIVSAIANWTFSKPSTEPALDIPEYALETSEDPQPVYALPSIPRAAKPLYTPVARVETKTRKPRAKKSEVIETATKASKKPRSIGAKRKPKA